MNAHNANANAAPDLATILRTLSQVSGGAAATSQNHGHSTTSSIGSHNHYHHPHTHPYSNPHSHSHSYSHSHSHPHPHAPSPRHPATQATQAPTDPSQITTYPRALRYTSALLAANTALAIRIRRLIKSQHDHERAWWAGRAAVPGEFRKRVEGRKAVSEVLKALGGVVPPVAGGAGGGSEDCESEESALREYDAKVFAKCREMERDVRRQLKEMGIPGFVVRAELVGDGQGKVTKAQIRELEAKMLLLLEDLCKD